MLKFGSVSVSAFDLLEKYLMEGIKPTPNPASLIGPIIKRSLFPAVPAVFTVQCASPSLKMCASPAAMG